MNYLPTLKPFSSLYCLKSTASPLKLRPAAVVLFFFLCCSNSVLFAQDQQSIKGNEKSFVSKEEQPEGLVIEKGMKFSILTFSLSSRNAVNDNNFFVNYLDQKKSSWAVRADGGYILRKNLGAGLGLSYGQSKENNLIKAADGALTSNRSFSNNYGVRPFIKNFIPLDRKNRFYIVNQTEIQLLFDRSIKESTVNEILTRTYTSKDTYGVGLRPGLMIFIVKNFAFETTVDIFGINTSVETGRTTGQPDTRVTTTDMNFKINILKIGFGFSTYF
ncbi:hypothetical protein AQ505_13610 [Pedobacter sp. PACM 27299]|uniref:hypothetical protein n=1 Tax=Pedobacter sp. PACM 27299 TaxID=1727164 RepID=UPI000705D7EC|nr:hypothetical protein [Pedobacter sp. PACM 27299]ALL06442.1 hypothetical protein AQ505_13610 [Pedobacter sp. PACM 27299]